MSGQINKNVNSLIKFVYSDNNSLSVIFHDNNLLMGVVGEFNKNLKELEGYRVKFVFKGKLNIDKIFSSKK